VQRLHAVLNQNQSTSVPIPLRLCITLPAIVHSHKNQPAAHEAPRTGRRGKRQKQECRIARHGNRTRNGAEAFSRHYAASADGAPRRQRLPEQVRAFPELLAFSPLPGQVALCPYCIASVVLSCVPCSHKRRGPGPRLAKPGSAHAEGKEGRRRRTSPPVVGGLVLAVTALEPRFAQGPSGMAATARNTLAPRRGRKPEDAISRGVSKRGRLRSRVVTRGNGK